MDSRGAVVVALTAVAGAGLVVLFGADVSHLLTSASDRATDALVTLVWGPKASREVARKRAGRRRALSQGTPILPAAAGLPSGNHLAKSWLVMDIGARPPPAWEDSSRAGWRLKLTGAVEAETSACLTTIAQLGERDFCLDWHCVTGWSAKDVCLRGVPLNVFIKEVCRPSPSWQFLTQRSADGYSTVVSREDCEDSSAFIALGFANTEGVLPEEHGGVRLVFPKLFGWKSAKFLSELQFSQEYRPGFWESLGCHARGRWEQGERWAPAAAGVWNTLTWLTSQYRFLFGYTIWVVVMQKGVVAVGRAVAALGVGKRPDPELSEGDTRARA